MKAVVLGATGYIGNAVVRELLHQGYEVTATSRRQEPAANLIGLPVRYAAGNSETPNQFDVWIAGHDVVVDAAAPYPLHLFSNQYEVEKRPLEYAAQRTDALLAAVRKHNARLAYVSSFTTIFQPRPGFDAWQAQLRRLLHPYFAVKDLIESRILTATKKGLPATLVNPTMCLGPWDMKEREFCIIPRLVCGEMPAAVSQMLNVIDVRDVARGLVAALRAERYGEPILLTGHNIATHTLFAWVCDIAGTKARPIFLPPTLSLIGSYWSEIAFSWLGQRAPLPSLVVMLACEHDWMSTSTAQHSLGITPRPLSETLGDTVSWYRYLGYC